MSNAKTAPPPRDIAIQPSFPLRSDANVKPVSSQGTGLKDSDNGSPNCGNHRPLNAQSDGNTSWHLFIFHFPPPVVRIANFESPFFGGIGPTVERRNVSHFAPHGGVTADPLASVGVDHKLAPARLAFGMDGSPAVARSTIIFRKACTRLRCSVVHLCGATGLYARVPFFVEPTALRHDAVAPSSTFLLLG